MQATPRTETTEICEINGIKFNTLTENFYICLQCYIPIETSNLKEHAFQHRKPQNTLQDDQRSISESTKSSTSNRPEYVTQAHVLTPVPPESKNSINNLIQVLVLNRNKKTQDNEPEAQLIDLKEDGDELSYGVHKKHKLDTEPIANEAINIMKENDAVNNLDTLTYNSQRYSEAVSSPLIKFTQNTTNPTPLSNTFSQVPNLKPQILPKDFRKAVFEEVIKLKQLSDSSFLKSKSSISENLSNIASALLQKSRLPISHLQKSLNSSALTAKLTSLTPPQQMLSPISPNPTIPLGIPTKSTLESIDSALSPLTLPIIHHKLPTISIKSPNDESSSNANIANVLTFSPEQVVNSSETQVYRTGNGINLYETREHLLSQFHIKFQNTISILSQLPVKRYRDPKIRVAEVLSKYIKIKGAVRKLAIIMKREISIQIKQGFTIWYKTVNIY